ncbi:MAG TPA: energy-coupling factor transporter transmembrane component T [Candidatus Limnocylindria bacterium]|jgi:energy-coupling factor transport system permease protein|nr:energy-coupling factor transporter transmembrane component T [Candidatus Limnocylindria bacterium]
MAGRLQLSSESPGDRGLPQSIGRPGPSSFHRLNPLTKATLATTSAIAAVIMGGLIGPILVLAAAVVVPAAAAGVLRRLAVTSALLALPIALSAFLLNLFFFPGGQQVLLRIGPVVATAEGLAFALEILVRIMAISGAVTLFYLTTRAGDLVVDLERRGVSPRVAFVANASVQTVPAMVERASQITAAQRARGLDTEGSFLRRARGVVPIVGPVILGSIAEVEERTLALEARSFSRPGRRTLLWAPADSSLQAISRWALVAGVIGLVVARIAGILG